MTSHLRATRHHLPYGITQCYLPPDTSELAPTIVNAANKHNNYVMLKLKNAIALRDKSYQSYEASLAVWDHTVLPATRCK